MGVKDELNSKKEKSKIMNRDLKQQEWSNKGDLAKGFRETEKSERAP
jgi:hypothetical protein